MDDMNVYMSKQSCHCITTTNSLHKLRDSTTCVQIPNILTICIKAFYYVIIFLDFVAI